MKRLLLTVALCVAASASFAQKKAVKTAESLAKGANFTEARTEIKGALSNPETEKDAQAWYVAGFIEDEQYNAELKKQMLGQQPNEAVMYTAISEMLPYFVKAQELDNLPDAKGKVKPKYTKKIIGILTADHVSYFNGGAYYFEKQDYKNAYKFFNQYLDIAELPFMADTKVAVKDSLYMNTMFYAAVSSTMLDDKAEAIKALERAKTSPFRQSDIYQYLASEYQKQEDEANFLKTLNEGLELFPDVDYFLMNLIDYNMRNNQNDKAIEMLNTAISKNSNNALLYNAMGIVYESGIKDLAKAEENFRKAMELDPNSADYTASVGRIFFNRGVQAQDEANRIEDQAKYQEMLNGAKELFKQALPYFEKAHQLAPEQRDVMVALRNIYYQLNMGDKMQEIEAKM